MPLIINGTTHADGDPLLVNEVQLGEMVVNGTTVWVDAIPFTGIWEVGSSLISFPLASLQVPSAGKDFYVKWGLGSTVDPVTLTEFGEFSGKAVSTVAGFYVRGNGAGLVVGDDNSSNESTELPFDPLTGFLPISISVVIDGSTIGLRGDGFSLWLIGSLTGPPIDAATPIIITGV